MLGGRVRKSGQIDPILMNRNLFILNDNIIVFFVSEMSINKQNSLVKNRLNSITLHI